MAFEGLVSPTELTIEMVLFIFSFLSLVLFSGIKLRSLTVISLFSMNLIILILTILVGLPFIWFWVSIFVSSIAITLAAVVAFIL